MLLTARRLIPEVVGLTLWISAERSGLALPLSVFGLVGVTIIGGCVIRAGLYLAILVHGAGHALAFAALMPGIRHETFRERMVDYLAYLPLRGLWPGQKIFIPGFSPESEAPSQLAPADGWRTRIAALTGPLVNASAAVGFSHAMPPGFMLDPTGVMLGVLAATQGLSAFSSWSDFKTILTGSTHRLFCGNLVVLGKVNAQSTERSHFERERRMWWQIVVRGSQSGGQFLLTKKGFVGWKGLNPKRAKLPQTVGRGFYFAKVWARIRGARDLDGIHQTHSHVRFATGGSSTQNSSQPMSWRDAHSVTVWEIDGGKITQAQRIQHHLFSFNGDIDGWVRRKGDPAHPLRLFDTAWSGPELQRLLTKILGASPVGSGRDRLIHTDTILGAGFQELLLTQGRWDASFRMAYALVVAEKPDDVDVVLRDKTVCEFNGEAEVVWNLWLNENGVTGAGCKTLADLYEKASEKLPGLILALEVQSLSMRGLKDRLDHEKRSNLIRTCVLGFFLNDLREACRSFAEYANGTYGLVMQSSLYPGEVSLVSFKQPIYIGMHASEDPEEDYLVVASEAASVLVAGEPGPRGCPKRPAYLYWMRDGEQAHLRLNPGSARSIITFRDGFGPEASETVQILNPANLDRWTRQSEKEGGRGWVSLDDNNPYFHEGRSSSEAADPVREGLDKISAVFDSIQRDWDAPTSFNRRTAEAFCNFLLIQARHTETDSKKAQGPSKNARLDLLVLGAGESLVLGAAFVEDLQQLFPKLHLKAMDSKTFAIDPEGLPVGSDTLILGVSHSGQYFNTLDDVKFLQAAHRLGCVGPVFVLTGQMATLMGQAVGQSFKSEAPFGERIFTDGVGWRLEEPHGLTTSAAHFTLSQLLLQLAERAASEPSSDDGRLGVSADDIRFLRSRLMETPRQAEELTGRNIKYFRLESPVHAALHREGRWLSWFLLEPLMVSVLSAIHLGVVFAWGTNPVVASVAALPEGMRNGVSPVFWSCVAVYGQAVYFFLMAPIVIALLLRAVMRRPLTDRFTGRNLYIAERGWVAFLVESFVRRLFALGYGFSGFQDPKAGDPAAGFIDEVAPSITRGDILVNGVSADPTLRATVGMVSTQLRGGPSLGQSAYAIGIGQEESARSKFHKFVSVGGAADSATVIGKAARRIDESRIASLYRLIGHYVMFHALASRVQRKVNAMLPIINTIGFPVFSLVYILSLGRWAVWFRPWNISETQSRANIFTTSVAPPIDVRPEEYRPLLWDLPMYSNDAFILGHNVASSCPLDPIANCQ